MVCLKNILGVLISRYTEEFLIHHNIQNHHNRKKNKI